MKRRGISIISLSIMVIVMIIILSGISVSLTYSITNAKKLAFAKEIYNIQNIVDEYIKKEGVLPDVAESITITPTDVTDETIVTQFEGETFTDGSLNLEVLVLTNLDIKNTNYGNKTIGSSDEEKAKDVYAVSSKTGRVYYIAGFKSGDKTYYTLTDELRQMVEKDQNTVIGEKTITFTPSKIGWASEGVSVEVFVPSEFTSPNITINNENISYTETIETNGITYTVNDSKVAENYTITVNYTKNGTGGTATYTTKIDTTAPIIAKDNSIANTQTHIKGLNATDSLSGIAEFKYAQGAVQASDAKSYMYAYGKNINNGNIKFANKTVYTLYAEDKVGNYIVNYINSQGELVMAIESAE